MFVFNDFKSHRPYLLVLMASSDFLDFSSSVPNLDC